MKYSDSTSIKTYKSITQILIFSKGNISFPVKFSGVLI